MPIGFGSVTGVSGFGKSLIVKRGIGKIVASGGTVAIAGGYKYHIFTSTGNFSVSSPGTVEFLLIGGGGGGGAGGDSWAGGGGAGGVVYNFNHPLPAATYTISVGSFGGASTKGSDTTAFGYTAIGGGYGSSRAGPGGPGGSGGGGAAYSEGSFSPGTALQPSANPGLTLTYQIGKAGWFPNPTGTPSNSFSPTGSAHTGGSSNPTNSDILNPSFPNSSTIISASPLSAAYFARGGCQINSPGIPWSPGWPGYGNGGYGSLGGPGGSGTSGIVIIRYPE